MKIFVCINIKDEVSCASQNFFLAHSFILIDYILIILYIIPTFAKNKLLFLNGIDYKIQLKILLRDFDLNIN